MSETSADLPAPTDAAEKQDAERRAAAWVALLMAEGRRTSSAADASPQEMEPRAAA